MPRITDHAAYFSAQVTRTRRFYHADWRSEESQSTRLCVVGGGCEWCAPDFVVDRRHFPYVAFEFVREGRGSVQLGRERQDIAPGHAYFFDATVPHVIRTAPDSPLVKYFFNFAGRRITALLAELKLRPGSVIRVRDAARLAELLDEAIDHALRGTRLGLRVSDAALELALTLCAESRGPAHARPDPSFATYLRCRQFILRNYPVVATVAEAARACNVTASYLTRLFQRFDHETPYTCLRRLKMNQARLKLGLAEVQAKAVAAELGFKSAAHFSRAFKRYHGHAPTETQPDK
jgi:AraC-like DNA-binding protein/mannose-6-phosphate isomerase-like protein (cupin superfamily)